MLTFDDEKFIKPIYRSQFYEMTAGMSCQTSANEMFDMSFCNIQNFI